MSVDQEKLNQLLGQFVADFGASLHAGMVVIGEKLGLYKAIARAGQPITSGELAQLTAKNSASIRTE